MSTSCFIASGCPIATTSLYRCQHLAEQLRDLGHAVRVVDWFEEASIRPEEALAAEVIFLYRLPMSGPLAQVIEGARARRKPVVFDTDDLIFEPDLLGQHRAVSQLSAEDQVQHAADVRRYLATLEACETTIAATPPLVEFARRRGRIAYVHRNALGHEMLAQAQLLHARRLQRPKRDAVVIGYGCGTATHEVDFAQASSALRRVLEQFPQTELWLAGPLETGAGFEQFGARVRRFPLTDWRGWFELQSEMDIALAPLEQGNAFCESKSEIKFVEAGILGVPVVASFVAPYRAAITHGRDGYLAKNEQEWVEALTALITEPETRERVGRSARAIVEQRHSPAARTRDLACLLPQLAPAEFSPCAPPTRRVSGFFPQVFRRFRRPKKLTINWLIPEPFPGAGGDLGIFRIIRLLAERGHDCRVYVVGYESMQDFSTEQVREFIGKHFGPSSARYFRWRGQAENADCTFATFWPTLEQASGLLKGGRRYYLVQDFEPDFYPNDPHHIRRAENTYRAGWHCITLGPWLARLLRERYGAKADYFDFAVETGIYRPQPVAKTQARRICFYARPATPRRGYELGIAALQLVHAQHPEVEIVFYGTPNPQPRPTFPFTDRGLLAPAELAALFSSCEVGLVLSLSNPSFVPLEMMACRCAVVEVASERLEGIATHGQDAWLVPPEAQAIADGILRLLEDNSLRQGLVEKAYACVCTMDWAHSARQIETILLRES